MTLPAVTHCVLLSSCSCWAPLCPSGSCSCWLTLFGLLTLLSFSCCLSVNLCVYVPAPAGSVAVPAACLCFLPSCYYYLAFSVTFWISVPDVSVSLYSCEFLFLSPRQVLSATSFCFVPAGSYCFLCSSCSLSLSLKLPHKLAVATSGCAWPGLSNLNKLIFFSSSVCSIKYDSCSGLSASIFNLFHVFYIEYRIQSCHCKIHLLW